MRAQPNVLSAGRISSLDGLRGIAAFAVLGFHYTSATVSAHGYLAVDLFFMMSGFVLAAVYEARLRSGMSGAAFLKRRMERLYPVYVVALIVAFALAVPLTGLAVNARKLAFNLVFLPDVMTFAPQATTTNTLWLENVSWSLSLEILINVAVAFGAWRLSTRALGVIVALAGAAYLVATSCYGTNAGEQNEAHIYLVGYARVLFGFPLGWLMWRLRHRLEPLASRRASLLALVLLVQSFLLTGEAVGQATVVLLMPVALAALALGPSPSGRLAKAATVLGALSYPLYLFHIIVAHVVAALHLPWQLGLLSAIALSVAAALMLHKTVEPLGRELLASCWRGARRRALAPA